MMQKGSYYKAINRLGPALFAQGSAPKHYRIKEQTTRSRLCWKRGHHVFATPDTTILVRQNFYGLLMEKIQRLRNSAGRCLCCGTKRKAKE